MKMGIFVIKGVFIMKNFKKVIALGLATTAVVSAMSMTALANYDDTAYESLPTLSEVDTSKASRETPVKYVDEKTGTIVTIYDPNITVEFPSVAPNSNNTVLEGRIYVRKASSERFGTLTESFEATQSGKVNFTLTDFNYPKYNVSLNHADLPDDPMVVLENKDIDVPVSLRGVESGSSYCFRVSSYMGAGSAEFDATM